MKTIIVCGARSGRHPLEILAREPTARVSVLAYDCHTARRIREDVGERDVEVILAPRLPAERVWDEGHFFVDAKSMSAEFQLDCLQDLFQHVPPGAVHGVNKPTKKKVTERVRSFESTWTASVPGGEKLPFLSLPGCFCHRRADDGGLALAEVAVRDYPAADRFHRRPQQLRLLDVGCGCGLVGLLVARSLDPAAHVTLLDSHTRAVEAADRNARTLGVAADCILSDEGTPAETDGTYDLALANPPYFGDWSIAERFLSTAARALKPRGVCYAVAKNGAGLMKIARAHFEKVESFPRRGYAVLKCR